MNILHVIAAVEESGGGTSEVVPKMCEELVGRGHCVRLLTLNFGSPCIAARMAEKRGVDIIYCKPFTAVAKALAYSPEFKSRVFELVHWADVVHLHGAWQWPCWCVAGVAHKLGKPYVSQPHGFLAPERLKKSHVLKSICGAVLERPLLRRAKCIIATAESEKVGLEEFGIDSSVKILPIGLDMLPYTRAVRNDSLLQSLGVPKGKRTVLYFSRLAPIKGLDMLAEAWGELGDFHAEWHLLIVGPDTQGYSDVVKKMFSHWTADGSVTINGPLYGQDKYDLLASADLFVLPTRNENFSIAVQEALASGLPTVCTKGAPWESLNGYGDIGASGFWVDVDSHSIASGLSAIMSASDKTRQLWGENGKALISKLFSWGNLTELLEAIYHGAIKG